MNNTLLSAISSQVTSAPVPLRFWKTPGLVVFAALFSGELAINCQLGTAQVALPTADSHAGAPAPGQLSSNQTSTGNPPSQKNRTTAKHRVATGSPQAASAAGAAPRGAAGGGAPPQASTGNNQATAQVKNAQKKGAIQGTPPAAKGAKNPAPGNKPPANPPQTANGYLQDICSLTARKCKRVGSVNANTGAMGGNDTALSDASLQNGIVQCPNVNLRFNAQPLNAQPVVDASTIASQLGTTTGFTLTAVGNLIYIYSKTQSATQQSLEALENQIGAVSAASAGFLFDLTIPNASSLGDIATALSNAAPSGLTVTSMGTTSVRVASDGSVSCSAIAQFLGYIRKFAHHTKPDTPVASVFYLDPASAANALGATAIPFAQGGAAALSSAPTGGIGNNSPSSPSNGNAQGNNGGSPQSGAANPQNKKSGSGAGKNATTTNPQAGSEQKKNATGNGASAANAPVPQSPSDASGGNTDAGQNANSNQGSAKSGPATNTPNPPPAQTPFSVNGRDLYFSGGTVGDDAWITEKKRVLALLDLPQPQVLVNAWVMQNSTSKSSQSGQLTNLLHEVVNSYNDTIQKSLYFGWSELQNRSKNKDFFNDDFYRYITLRSVFDPRKSIVDVTDRPGTAGSPSPSQGFCEQDRYCLGYSTLFQPTQPRLTDMLLTLIAAQNPAQEANWAVSAIEDWDSPEKTCKKTEGESSENSNQSSSGKAKAKKAEETESPEERDLRKQLLLQSKGNWSVFGCQEVDENYLLNRQKHHADDQRFPLECFREAMSMMGSDNAGKSSIGPPSDSCDKPSRYLVPQVGLVRAALADFLFQYKLSQQYPHEFAPYDLTASAQTLDGALTPFIHAFNEDLQAFQSFVRAEVVVGSSSMKLSGDKNTFVNDGIITVQTTSGDIASVSTGTQSYMNVSKAPSISQLASSITGANAGSSSSPLTGVLSNLSGNEAQALIGALAAYQTTTLNVGRQLNLVVKPRSLLGASAAEMDVQLNADQSPSAPNYWSPSGGPGTPADLSAVTQHDVTTHVRVDSIRLFDVSSFTAMLSKGRDKFPVLPPFVEIPYIGTLLGVPLPAAREYHNSNVVMSAVIVPTATDIAYSLRFVADRVVAETINPQNQGTCDWTSTTGPHNCALRKATSLGDFGGQSVREFHRLKLHCIITLGVSPFPTASDSSSSDDICSKLTFSNTLRDDGESGNE